MFSVKRTFGVRLSIGVNKPRTRKIASNANTPSWSSISSSIPIKKEFTQVTQNGDERQQRRPQEMESLLEKHNEVMPCMTGLDRVTNWKLSSECNDIDDYEKVRILLKHVARKFIWIKVFGDCV